MQRGIETQDMDVRWVSSLSWYFLNFLGLNGLYRLILGGENAAADPQATTTPFDAPQGQPGQPQDFGKLFKAELDNLAFAEGLHKWAGVDVEERILKKYGVL